MRSHRKQTGFTIVELLIVIVVIAILAVIVVVAFNGAQRQALDSTVRQTIVDGTKKLLVYNVENTSYPSNLADTQYISPQTVSIALYTNAPQTPVYQSLTSAQNAQLFLNSCNGFMPITSGGTTYNTGCSYAGNNAHVSGQNASNIVIHGPTVNQSDFVLICGSACSTAQGNIISTFLAQGGTFPVTVPSGGATLPAPTLMTAGQASRFCLEGRSAQYSDIVYHTSSESTALTAGACPNDPTLHYP